MNTRSTLGAILVAAALAALPGNARAAQGDLDPTFGQQGRVVTGIAVPGHDDFFPLPESILVQPDGKVLVCGRFWQDGISYWYGTFIVRYLPDGTLDPSFGEEGKVAVIDPGFPYDTWNAGAGMALRPDGRIVLIGQNTLAAGIIVRRYTSTGLPDTTFGDDGAAVVPRRSEFTATEGRSIALQPDGRIVGLGWEYERTDPYYNAMVLFRMNDDGSMDETFGAAGAGIVRILTGYDGGTVLIQPDGRILVAGTLLNFRDIPPTPLLARFNRDGSPDSSFGDSGLVTDRIEGLGMYFSSAALQPDGKIIALGQAHFVFHSRTLLVRYNADGARDTGFGANGVFAVDSSFFGSPQGVALGANRTIVAFGNAPDDTGGNGLAILRLRHDGTLDPGFGAGGRALHTVIPDGSTQSAFTAGGTVRRDGRILVIGSVFGEYSTVMIRVDAGQRFRRARENTAFRPPAPEPRPAWPR